ncbi:pleckstrin homology domain-containing family G member 5 isoform X1 [Hydra vulgaris]|uniref:pleckstrin homology domain-containing family G member 5 isoform X1 n=2 Tax=Hydra vulgaris TaxID=6087 RepID=UPI0032EA7294
MSSKEYFTLQFYNDLDSKVDAEKVPVCKGKSLKESAEIYLSKRNLSFNTHSVFLESSKTPLPLSFDTFHFGGNILHVKANQEMQVDERIIMLMKASEDKFQVGPRHKKSEDNNAQNGKSSFTPKLNRKVLQSKDFSNSLKDVIHNISDMLAQQAKDNLDNGDNNDSEFDNEVFLEDSWTDVITEVSELSQECRIQQEAIWELLMTEKNYIRKIRLIIKVFQKYLVNLQESGILTEVDPNKLFSNILEVYEANMVFWTKHLNLVVKDVRRTKQTINPLQLLDSFSNFEEIFNPYIHYCMEEANCVKYLKLLRRKNEFFVEYLLWCENSSQCMRLKLADLLVKPMQRITKYNLLLKVILKKTRNEKECLAIEKVIAQVEQFVGKINAAMRLQQEEQKLNAVLDKLELYLPIESVTDEVEKHVAEYCKFDLRAPIPGLAAHEKRFLLYDGPMKIVEKNGRIDVQAFLFTDVLIMTKPKRGGEKYRIVRQPYCLSKVVLHVLAGSLLFVYLNEYGVMSTAFTLLLNPNEQSKWIEAIDKAKIFYEKERKENGSTSDLLNNDNELQTLKRESFSQAASSILIHRNFLDLNEIA